MIPIPKGKHAAILAALYNNSKPQGMGFLQFQSGDLSEEKAAELLKQGDYFDYLQGRVMKVRIAGDEFDPRLYDRDNGQGSALRAVEHLLNSGQKPERSVANPMPIEQNAGKQKG